jgi:glycosyltransferase involved in cell wall biosynthesis
MIISCEDDEPATPIDRLRLRTARPRAVMTLAASSGAGLPIRVHPVESDKFSDYIWQRLFAKGLAPEEFERIRNARYVSIQPPWLSMHTMGMMKRYPRLDTRDFDIMVAHTPWPSRVSARTELVVRYHDAIPMFHPHQIKLPAMHQFHHASALRSNVRHASFVCTSEATRKDLLTLYPEVEPHTRVIPTSVSSDYHPEPASDEVITELVRAYSTGGKPPRAVQDADDGFRYLLMVSTIEPRKNHIRLIEAWERIRRLVDPGLQLVVVGGLGWGHGQITNRMKRWQQRGGLHHLTAVPTADLRLFYSNAEAVVCPSVVEGFDMSGIEAMICGTPVIASDIDVHRENYGSAARYFDPYATDDLVRVLRSLLYGEHAVSERRALVHNGVNQAKLFRRAELGEQWGELFEDITAGRFGARRFRSVG